MSPLLTNSERRSPAILKNRMSPLVDAPAPLRLWHLASLDAPTVAVVWTLAFAWAAKVRLPLWAPVLLALVAWAVYIGDRLLDADTALRLGASHRLRERHLFHWRHRRILLPVAAASACAAAWIVLTLMPAGVRQRDSVLGAAAIAYFSGVHSAAAWRSGSRIGSSLFFRRNCLSAFSSLPPVPCPLGIESPPPQVNCCSRPTLPLLAWLNCHAIDRWESGAASPRAPGIVASSVLLDLAGLLLAVFLASSQPRAAALVICGAASALLLALLDGWSARLTPLALRAAADLVLLTPLALLLR